MVSLKALTQQTRLADDRIICLAGGLDLNGNYFSDTFIDPVTKTLMLLPAPLYPDWYTDNTGIFTKPAVSDFTASTPSNWFADGDYKYGTEGGAYISSIGNAPGTLVYNTTPAKNRGFYVSIFAYGGGDNYTLVEMGWNSTPSIGSSVGLRLYSGGEMEVWKDGVLKGVYNISGAISASQQTNIPIDLFLIPSRKKELLVITRNGNGFTHIFDDIEETDTDPIITPAQKFFVNIPVAKAQVQIAPLKFKTSGYATSLPYQLSKPPENTDTLIKWDNPTFAGGTSKNWFIMGDSPYSGSPTTTTQASLVATDGTSFVANGSNSECRLKVAITGDGDYTPFIYGAQVGYNAVFLNTDNSEEFEVLPYLLELGLDVPEGPTDTSLRVVVKEPYTLSASGIANFLDVSNRPYKFSVDSVDVIDGVSEPVAYDASTTDLTQRADFQIRDRWKPLENYMFTERVVLDSQTFTNGLKFILTSVGISSGSIFIEESGFILPSVAPKECGEFNLTIEVGDTASEWIQRLFETFASSWYYGFEPSASGIIFVAKSEETMNAEDPEIVLYPSIQSAIDNGISSSDAWKYVYRSYRQEKLEPEANDIRVTGWDIRDGRAIQSHKIDLDSVDVTLAPSLQPSNWLGEVRHYGYVSVNLTSQDACNRACEYLYNHLTPSIYLSQIHCEFLVNSSDIPIWKGKNIYLYGIGKFRIVSFGIDIERVMSSSPSWTWQEGTYSLRYVG